MGPVGIILIVAAVLKSFRENKYVNRAFYGLRPASAALIGAACVAVVLEVLTGIEEVGQGLVNSYRIVDTLLNWKGLILAAVLLLLTNRVKKVKDLHPVVFIGISAVVGILFHFGGV